MNVLMRYAILTAGVLLLLGCNSKKATTSQKIYPVKKAGDITLTEAGLLESVNNTMVVVPANWSMEFRVIYLAPEGEFIAKGDTVVKFNSEKTQSDLDEAQAAMDVKLEKLNEVKRRNAINLREKESQLLQLEWENKISINKVEQARYESDIRLKEAELEQEKIRLRLKQAKLKLEAQKVINAKEIKLVHIEIEQATVEIERARARLADMVLFAPKAGMVIYQRQYGNDEKIKVGETVRPRRAIVSIPDLQHMKVTLRLNEVDKPFIKVGQKAIVRIEAYPDTLFTGTVQQIDKMSSLERGFKNLKTYKMDVVLDAAANYRLKPGLSAMVEVVTEHFEDAWEIPGWCLSKTATGYAVVNENGDKTEVDVVKVQNGTAIITGKLSQDIKLQSAYLK